MKRAGIAWFETICTEQLMYDAGLFGVKDRRTEMQRAYDALARAGSNLPERATVGSAGYDIISPIDTHFEPGVPVNIPTCLRCWMENDYFLMIVPRSGLAFRYGLRLVNSFAIIDSDYYYADNVGHIVLRMTADSELSIKAGDKIAQGIFLPYGLIQNDATTEERHGGFGSTSDSNGKNAMAGEAYANKAALNGSLA